MDVQGIRSHTLELLSAQIADACAAAAVEKRCVESAIQFSNTRGFTCSWNNPRFRKVYATTVRNMIRAVQCNNAQEWKQDDLIRLVDLPTHEVFQSTWNESVDAHNKKIKNAYETRMSAKTTQFRCPKCKQNECDFYEMQCRSADESMSIFITCLTCGHRWRIG